MNQHKDDNVEEILEELKNVLDSITKQSNLNNNVLYEEKLKKVEDLKSTLEFKQRQNTVESNQQEIEKSTEAKFEEIKNKSQVKLQENALSKYDDKKESASNKQLTQETSEIKDKILINAMFLFPSVLKDAKDIFFSNINSTLKRVSKKDVEVLDAICIDYSSLSKDILLQYSLIVDKINKHNINVLILLTNEDTSEVENFIKKISSFVILAKSIDIKKLNLKSTYLDLSIDLLLNIKQQ